MDLLEMMGSAQAGSVWTHSYAAGAMPPPPGSLRSLCRTCVGSTDYRGNGNLPPEQRAGVPNPVRGLRGGLRHLGPNDPCPTTECPECKGCHPIFYLGTATAAILVLGLILK